jgi:hypothetical protein
MMTASSVPLKRSSTLSSIGKCKKILVYCRITKHHHCIFAVANGFVTIKMVNIVTSLLLVFSKNGYAVFPFLSVCLGAGGELRCFFGIATNSLEL